MLLTLALAVTVPTSCTDVKHVCRACPSGGNVARCSNIGIACQPTIRICRPKGGITTPAPGTLAKRRRS